MKREYQVDVWAGDLHQSLVETGVFQDWSDAAEFMQSKVDAGLLCNVLHEDFKAPACVDKPLAAKMLAVELIGRVEG